MSINSTEEGCARAGLAAAACDGRGSGLDPQREAAIKLCARLFPDQGVLQTACTARCASHMPAEGGDAQDCAFRFARSSHEIVLAAPEDHSGFWLLLLVGALVAGICWFALRRYRKTST